MAARKKRAIEYAYNLKVYFGLLSRYRFLFAGLLLVVLLVETASLADKILFKKVIDHASVFITGAEGREAFIGAMLLVGGIFIAVSLATAALKWLFIHLINHLDADLIADLKRKFFNHIIGLSHRFHTTHRTGSLISRLARGGRAVESLTDSFVFNFFPLLFQAGIISLSFAYYDAILSLTVVAIVLIFVTFSYIIQVIKQRYDLAANDAEDLEKAYIGDFFMNIDSIKYFGKERATMRAFQKLTGVTRNAALRHWDYYRLMEAGQALIVSSGVIAIVYLSVIRFMDKRLTLGDLAFIYSAYGNLLPLLYSFSRGIRQFYHSIADLDSLFRYGKIENEITDIPGARKMAVKEGIVEFKDVTFGYGKRVLFSNFSLRIPKNRKIALVGHSGSGKSTLIKLLYRLYDVQEGEILIDGKNIKSVKQESLREELSIVPQECILFDDTLYNNVAFSMPHASRAEVMRAMKLAQLDRVIRLMPRKENTIVGERGVKLSGGEKQRVSIARAILADRRVLVLDEATSSLDSKTESEIQAALQKLIIGRTTIIIAHRLSTILTADQIIVIDEGKISQSGTHAQLIGQKGIYRNLWELQKGGYIGE